jgi:hypothetical protein
MMQKPQQLLLREGAVLFVGLLLTALAANWMSVLFLHPQGTHVWRQCDGASYALNYFQNDQPFLQPQTHTLTGENGHTVSEFPIVYFCAAKLYKAFGFHDWFIRWIHLFFFLGGVIYTWLITRRWVKKPYLSLIPPLFLFGTSYILYYGPNYLPDVAALCLGIAALYHFLKAVEGSHWGHVLLYAAFTCFAMLLKISCGILPLAAACAWFVMLVQGRPDMKMRSLSNWIFFPALLLALLINLEWVSFAKHYNQLNHTGQNLLGLFPIWESTFHGFLLNGKAFATKWSYLLMSPICWGMIAYAAFMIYKQHKQLPHILKYLLLFCGLGTFAYALGWFQAFTDHDYYMICMFAFPLLMVISGTVLLDQRTTINLKKTYRILALLFILNAAYNIPIQGGRFHVQNIKPVMMEIQPYLRSIGIDRHQKVMSVPDGSPNITLYFMNNPGWTECFNSKGYDLVTFKAQGCKYLIVSDSSYLQNDFYKAFFHKQIGFYKGVYIFEI